MSELAALASGGEEDRHLLNACLEVEYELRRRQWDALERLLPFLEAEDEWDGRGWLERLEELPEPEVYTALRAAYDAWWIAGWEEER
jgi:hypothetical protein